MEIRGPGGVGGPREVNPDRKPGRVESREGQSRGAEGDRVEISDMARLKGLLANVPPVRAERIAALREKIKNGGYPPAEVLDKALDKMMEEELGL